MGRHHQGVPTLAVAQDRQDLLDVYLIAAPKFFIGTNSGPVWAAGTFGVPTILTNWFPIGIEYHYPSAISLPRRLWARSENRFLTDEEQNVEPYAFIESEAALLRYGLLGTANAPNDIAAAVDRMIQTLCPL